jgi:hypothetical protein
VSNSLWAFTTMKHPLAHALASLVVEITPRLIEAFDPEAEAQAARAEASAEPAASPAAETRRRRKTGGAFVAQTISNQLWCFGTLRRHPGDAHLDALARAVAKHVTHFKPQELTNVVWAYAALAHYPGDECMCAFEHEIARRAKKGEWNPQNLSTLVMAVASFPHDDAASRASLGVLMRALDHDEVVTNVAKFNFQDLANAAFGVAVAGGFASRLFAALWERVSRLERDGVKMNAETDSGALMLYNAKLLAEAVAPRVARSLPPLPAWLETQAEALWTKQAERGTVSEFQRDVSRRLRDLGVAHSVEAKTEDGKMSADIDIPLPEANSGHLSVALECDGPSHFCVNRTMGAVPLSRNGVRDALLGARGKRVVVVPWDEWAVREDEGVAEAWLRARLEAAGVVVGIS